MDKTWRCMLKIKCDGCLRCIITSSAVQFWHLFWRNCWNPLNILVDCSQRTFHVMLKFCSNNAFDSWSFAKVSLMMIICKNDYRTRASSLKGGMLWNNCMSSILICYCTEIKENPKFQHQQSSTVQSKNEKPRCSLIVHFKRLLQAPMNSEQWWFWGRLMLSLQFWCHPGPSLPIQVREDLGQGSIVEH